MKATKILMALAAAAFLCGCASTQCCDETTGAEGAKKEGCCSSSCTEGKTGSEAKTGTCTEGKTCSEKTGSEAKTCTEKTGSEAKACEGSAAVCPASKKN